MTFYHGSNMIIGKIDLGRSRNRVDFGKRFYTGGFLRLFLIQMSQGTVLTGYRVQSRMTR